jgi:nicotinamidase-related amidase
VVNSTGHDRNEEYPMTYSTCDTAILLLDPYNDFISEGGKAWPFIKEVAEVNHLVANLRKVVATARDKGFKLFFVPHHRFEGGDFDGWLHPSPYQQQAASMMIFQKDTWGGTFHEDFMPKKGDVVIKEHWSSGFANTDLDVQLRQHGISKIILIGLIANTCVESTGRYGSEFGYHVTLVRDATAAFNQQAMHAAHEINGPTYAHEILSTEQLITQLSTSSKIGGHHVSA